MKTLPALAPDRRLLLALTIAGLMLTGCSSVIGPGPAPQLYVLRPAFHPLPDAPKAAWQLTVAMPSAPLSLDTARIALQRSSETMDYYADAAWQDRAPVIVQRALIEGFEQSGRIDAIARDTEGVRTDYLLQTDLRAFEARYSAPDGAPTVAVEIAGQLLRTPGRKIALTIHVRKTAEATANNVPAIVAAFDRALGEAVADLVTQSLAAPAPEG